MTESSEKSLQPGRLVVISGPSGVGKSTVLTKLFADCPLPLVPSVSATTRKPRPGELDGESYHFLSQAAFDESQARGEFLECCEVFGYGHWYGTLRQPVATGLSQGKWIVLEIDVEGATKVLNHYPHAITIFIHPGSLEELERRLRGRGTESESALQRRLAVAKRELEAAPTYRHIVTNQSVDQTAQDICQLLLQAEKH